MTGNVHDPTQCIRPTKRKRAGTRRGSFRLPQRKEARASVPGKRQIAAHSLLYSRDLCMNRRRIFAHPSSALAQQHMTTTSSVAAALDGFFVSACSSGEVDPRSAPKCQSPQDDIDLEECEENGRRKSRRPR